jgi:GTPase SAR1 family protein
MLSPDLPIEKLEEDGLNRGSFAESLAKTLVQYSFPSSLTIGLYGEWGSGKTSLLNMVFENVERIDDGVVVLRFNPWLCSDPKQLVTQFFKQMATAIKLKKRAADKAWEMIDRYADILGATSVIPVAGEIVAAVTKVITKKAEEETKERTTDLQESKNQIIKKLKDEKIKIIVSIDDIDRLSEEEIVAVFQLVKSLADFPNTIYVLAFDYDVVVRALGKVQHGDGKEYLEKIVQVPFEIPAPNIDDIHEALFLKLNRILGDIPEEDWDKETWGELFQQGIKNYIRSIRDVIRYTNVFSLKYELLKNETSAADLLGLTCLQVFEPTVYSKLPSYKDILCGERRSFSHERQKEAEEKVERAINRIAPDDGSVTDLEATKNILGTLFPGIKTNMGWSYGVGRGYSRRDSLIRNSIAAPECFDRYFALTLENGAIPTATVRRMVFESSESELAEEIMQIYHEGKIVRLLEAIEAYAGAGDGRIIDAKRAAMIIKVLSCNWSSFEVEDGGFFAVPFAWRLLYCVDPLLKSIDSKARASLMCSIFENEKVQVSTVALLLQDFENQLGRCAENARESADAVLPLDAVLKLEAIFKERAVKAIDSKVVLRQYHGLRFLWLLEQIAPETAADKKKSMVTDDVSLVKIIDECTSRGSVAVRIVAKTRTVDRDRLSEFVDLGEAYQRVKKFATENQFFDLPRDEQMSAVAFILIVERGPVESSLKDCIAEDAIIKALDQMKSKIETDDTQRD